MDRSGISQGRFREPEISLRGGGVRAGALSHFFLPSWTVQQPTGGASGRSQIRQFNRILSRRRIIAIQQDESHDVSDEIFVFGHHDQTVRRRRSE